MSLVLIGRLSSNICKSMTADLINIVALNGLGEQQVQHTVSGVVARAKDIWMALYQ